MTSQRNILGVSAFYHDSAAAILSRGEIVAAAQEERFSRKKHDPRFPKHAISYCMEEAFIEAEDLALVAFYDNTPLTIDRIIRNSTTVSPQGEECFSNALKSALGGKLHLRESLKNVLGQDRPLWFVDHHISHSASAFFPSPFEEAAVVTADGVGEHATLSIGYGSGNTLDLISEINYPHSLGLLYSAFTFYCGFKVNSGEYKLMGLAPYGKPIYADLIERHLIDIKEDGSFALNMAYFDFPLGQSMISEKFCDLFGGPARERESVISRREMDLAASVQAVTEKIMLLITNHARKLTGSKNLCMAGGVALNCVATGKIWNFGDFDQIWVQPAAGDAGGALGAALYADHVGLGSKRTVQARGSQNASYLGRRYSPGSIQAVLDREKVVYAQADNVEARNRLIAKALADGLIVGHFSGRMEFGPRALGARSIIGDPRSVEMQSKMNLSIKFRESFRPFAPIIKYDRVSDYFDFQHESPYMLVVAPVNEARRTDFELNLNEDNMDMIKIVNHPRSDIPAVTHVDFSARLQTVHPEDNPELYGLLNEFENLTGVPVLVNTSFNVRGEPIVESPADALRCFFRTEMDLLILENFLIFKDKQAARDTDMSWKGEFELD